MTRVVIVGAGLTGLATAWWLRDDLDVTLLEAADQPGGEIRTIPFAGTWVDVGADAFLLRQPAGERLVRAAGLGDDLVVPATGKVSLVVGGRCRPLPERTVLGAPTDPVALARSGVLGPAALARAALEPLLPRRRVVGDRSVADLVGERFGRAVVDRLVEPLLGGVYAGSADRLSAAAAAAPVWAAAQDHRSLLVGLAAQRRALPSATGPAFGTVRGGLGRLVDVLVKEGDAALRTGTAAVALARRNGTWQVRTAAGERLTADHVVLAVPARPAAALLADVAPDAARELAGIRTASVAVVALAYPRSAAGDMPEGSGLLVPRTERRVVKAATFLSQKWPHHADADHLLLRASVGRVDDRAALELDDRTLAARVEAEVRDLCGIATSATHVEVVRWPDALPQYDVGHLERVERIRHATRDLPGLHIAGASLDGIGLAARAAEAERLALTIRER